MTEKRIIVTLVCAVAVAAPAAASAAGDPLAQPKADLAKLTADANAAAATLAADAGSAKGQLKRDAKAGAATLRADWKVLVLDVAAARKAGGDKQALESLLRTAQQQLKGFRSAVRTAFGHGKPAAGEKEGSKGSQGSHGSNGKHSGPGSDDDGSGG
jgi:opacity protein-like surface antigen